MSDPVPTVELKDPQDALLPVLSQLQGALLRYPDAAQALLSALVAEGRAHARTPEGAALRDALVDSELLRRLWRSWEVTSLWMFDADAAPSTLPSGYVDALFLTAGSDDLEALLARLVARREAEALEGGQDGPTGAFDAP